MADDPKKPPTASTGDGPKPDISPRYRQYGESKEAYFKRVAEPTAADEYLEAIRAKVRGQMQSEGFPTFARPTSEATMEGKPAAPNGKTDPGEITAVTGLPNDAPTKPILLQRLEQTKGQTHISILGHPLVQSVLDDLQKLLSSKQPSNPEKSGQKSSSHPIDMGLYGVVALMALVVDFGVMIFLEAAPHWFVGITMVLSIVVIIAVSLRNYMTERWSHRVFWASFIVALSIWITVVGAGFVLFPKPDETPKPPAVFRRI